MTTARIQFRSGGALPLSNAATGSTWSGVPRQSAGIRAALQPDAAHAVESARQSPALSLDTATRAAMEPRFGRDFGDVRIHTGRQAEASAGAVDANAYTVGRDIVFGPGRYAPHWAEGRRLLAHELTHVVQQGASPGSHAQPQRIGAADDALEAEADRSADAVLHATAATAATRAVPGLPPVIQRDGPAKETKPAVAKASGYPTAW